MESNHMGAQCHPKSSKRGRDAAKAVGYVRDLIHLQPLGPILALGSRLPTTNAHRRDT